MSCKNSKYKIYLKVFNLFFKLFGILENKDKKIPSFSLKNVNNNTLNDSTILWLIGKAKIPFEAMFGLTINQDLVEQISSRPKHTDDECFIMIMTLK